MNLLPTVILYKIFISNNIRLPDRHKIIFHRNFYRNFSHILQLIKVFRCLTHDIPPLRLYIISIDLLPTTNIPITFGFKSKLNRSFGYSAYDKYVVLPLQNISHLRRKVPNVIHSVYHTIPLCSTVYLHS